MGSVCVSLLKEKQEFLVSRAVASEYEEKEPSGLRPVHIQIDSHVETAVESLPFAGGKWGLSPDKATYLLQSARPGNGGNTVIYGHNYKGIFAGLEKVAIGNIVTVRLENGQERKYMVTSKEEVDTADTSYIQPTDYEVLTLYTCSGVFNGKRLVVRAQ